MEVKDIKVQLHCNEHANLDSLPLRFGFNFSTKGSKSTKLLYIFDIKNIQSTSACDRLKVCGEFYNPDLSIKCVGTFVLLNEHAKSNEFFSEIDGKIPSVVTVWSKNLNCRKSIELEKVLSKKLRDLRISNQISVDEIKKLHPLYAQGKITTPQDLINALENLRRKPQ